MGFNSAFEVLILNKIFFFSKSCRLRDNVEKYGTASFAVFDLTQYCANNMIFVAVNCEAKQMCGRNIS